MSTKDNRLVIPMSDKTKEQLNIAAHDSRVTMAEFVRQLIEKELKRDKV